MYICSNFKIVTTRTDKTIFDYNNIIVGIVTSLDHVVQSQILFLVTRTVEGSTRPVRITPLSIIETVLLCPETT